MSLTDVERLVTIDDIKRLKATRIRVLDAKLWDEYAALHAPEHVSYLVPEPAIGAAAMMARVTQGLEGVRTIHQVFAPEIEILAADQATGIWPMEDRLFWDQDGVEHWLHGWGRYHETYVKRGGRWLFTSRRLIRSRVTMSPGGVFTALNAGPEHP